LNVSVGKDGQIILDPQAKIGGNLNYKAEDESQLIKKEGSEVLGETSLKNINDILISAPDKINKAFAATYLFLKVISLFSLLVIGIIIISLMPKIALKVHDQMSQKPAYSFGIGFIYFLVMPLISVFLFITIIGIPLSLIIIPIYLISLYIAKVFAGFTIGLIIFNKIFKGKYKQSLIIPLIFGLAIFVLLGSIPILGWIIKLLLVFWALGAMIKIKQEIVKEYS